VREEKKFRVLILGYGEMGHAMQHLLGSRHELRIWQRRPPSGTIPVQLENAAPECDFVLFCLPAPAHADVARRLAPHLRRDTICLTIAKGLDERGRLPFEALSAEIHTGQVAVLYGPMISEEIRAGRPAFAQCGVDEPVTYQRVAALYRGTALRLEASQDIAGLSWSAILKNVYAIAFGMADELGLGDNVRGFLAVTALQEIAGIAEKLGGDAATPYRLAGLGDLITTATSAGSHHHELGRLIARGEKESLRGEGVHTLAMLRTTRRFDPSLFPLYRLIDCCALDPAVSVAQMRKFLNPDLPG
jgi:glycerol-3-phosphate dehydrogenase (NAD(P)+)